MLVSPQCNADRSINLRWGVNRLSSAEQEGSKLTQLTVQKERVNPLL